MLVTIACPKCGHMFVVGDWHRGWARCRRCQAILIHRPGRRTFWFGGRPAEIWVREDDGRWRLLPPPTETVVARPGESLADAHRRHLEERRREIR
jgi:hypothetical protein